MKVAFRQLQKHKLFSLLNIFSLATSISICLLVIMAVRDQYAYDQFHDRGKQIYRVISGRAEKSMPLAKAMHATTSMQLAESLPENYPFIKQTVRMMLMGGDFTIDGRRMKSDGMGFATDQDFLNVFSFGWSEGDQHRALLNPGSIVLTESTARQFFPDADPLGANLKLGAYGDFSVTGIVPDPPRRSHIQFDFLISFSTLKQSVADQEKETGFYSPDEIGRGLVYLVIDDKATKGMLDEALQEQAAIFTNRSLNHHYLFESQALDDIMPSRDLFNEIGIGTPRIVLYFLMALGLMIILSACFNYVNLSVARSMKRAMEIGVRRVIGARKRDIVQQFLGEAILISLMAYGLALVMLEFLIPAFFALDPFVGDIFDLEKSLSNYLIFLGFSLLVGFFAGLFPAFHISGYQPLHAIRQLSGIRLFSHVNLRKALITVQFALSLFFIMTVVIVHRQQKYVLETKLGQDISNVLNVRLQGYDPEIFTHQVSQLVGVEDISASGLVMLSGENASTMVTQNAVKDSIKLYYNFVSKNFRKNLRIDLVAGTDFPEENSSGREQFIILNETAVQTLGYASPQQALGEHLIVDTTALVIIGIAKDFHHDNIWFSPVKPFGLRNKEGTYANLNIRIAGMEIPETVASIHAIWDKLFPDMEMSSFFLDERVYFVAKFFRMGSRIIGYVGFLAIIIACMGLLGMVIYTVEGRIKDVSIRKVLGATESNIVWYLSKGFVLLLVIAVLIAAPLTLIIANIWLQNFVLRISFDFAMVFFPISFLFIIGLLPVILQTYVAARTNPVKTLKND